MKTTLVILAAGIGSRFGGGIKQLEPVGPNGEIIIDYSIHDAIKAGFDKIVFIIRHDIENDFRARIGDRIEAKCKKLGVEVAYAYQELNDIPIELPEGRSKPWGTGHAILSCAAAVNEPFAVINADDYYGKNGFVKAAEFLKTGKYGMVGYILKNTLSDNGGVTRGICGIKEGKLVGIDETHDIIKTKTGAASNGRDIDVNSIVSMNFWCFTPGFMDELKQGFPEFLKAMSNPLKDEYLLPTIVDGMLKKGVEFTVMHTDDKWFGVTYKADKQAVVDSFKQLYAEGAYGMELYCDIAGA
ncbi:MAG: NTP transferase domain-containing protein [Clostridia bacterium]|nr:NTP transferase domain-containing protein [Clostridia bacterium]